MSKGARTKIARYRDFLCLIPPINGLYLHGNIETVANRSYIRLDEENVAFNIPVSTRSELLGVPQGGTASPLSPSPRMNYAFQRNFVSRDNIPKSKGSLLVSSRDNDRPSPTPHLYIRPLSSLSRSDSRLGLKNISA